MTTTKQTPTSHATLSTTEAADIIGTAVANGVLAQQGFNVGDHGLIVTHPADWRVTELDQRRFEDRPRERSGSFPMVGVRSLAQYVNRYKGADTLGWIHDVNGRGPAALTGDLLVAEYVLDDFPNAPANGTSNRSHRAQLVLRPTPQARRWGKVLTAATIDQETLLDLVVDGIGEIVEPDGAVLRDLVSDLHAVRNTSVRSVIRKGGEATVEVAENVTLHAGVGNTVTVPDMITVTFQPFASVPDRIVLNITVKPKVREEKVTFTLTAPALDSALCTVVSSIAEALTEATTIEPLWMP